MLILLPGRYHIIATYDNSTAHIYVNGVDLGSGAWNSPIAGINNNIIIGYGSGLSYCNCSMYTFKLYDRSLPSDEVLQNYYAWKNKMSPAITWSNPADITYGTALNSTQLNAVAKDPVSGDTVAGTFTYSPGAGSILDVGTHTLHVDFTSSDPATYNTTSADVQINVLDSSL